MSSLIFAAFVVALAVETVSTYGTLTSRLPAKRRSHILRATIIQFMLLLAGSLGFLWLYIVVFDPFISLGKQYPLSEADAFAGMLLTLYLMLSWVFVLVNISRFLMRKMLTKEDLAIAKTISDKAMRGEDA